MLIAGIADVWRIVTIKNTNHYQTSNDYKFDRLAAVVDQVVITISSEIIAIKTLRNCLLIHPLITMCLKVNRLMMKRSRK